MLVVARDEGLHRSGSLDEVVPVGGAHLGGRASGAEERDGVGGDGMEEFGEVLSGEIHPSIDCSVVPDELLLRHLLLHLRIVLVGVKHDQGVAEDEHGVLAREDLRRLLLVEPVREGLQDPLNLLRLPWQSEGLEVATEGDVEDDAGEVEGAGEFVQHLDVELVGIAKKVPDLVLVQARREAEEVGQALRLGRAGHQLGQLQEVQPFLVVSVVVVCRDHYLLLLELPHPDELHPPVGVVAVVALLDPEGLIVGDVDVVGLAVGSLVDLDVVGDGCDDGDDAAEGLDLQRGHGGAHGERDLAQQPRGFLQHVVPQRVAVVVDVCLDDEVGLVAEAGDPLDRHLLKLGAVASCGNP